MTTRYEKIQLDHGLPIKFHHFVITKNEHTVKKHYHNSIEIIFPVTGSIKIWDNGEEKILKQGSLYIINSRNVHMSDWMEDTPYYDGYCLQINLEFVKSMVRKQGNFTFKQPDEFVKDAMKKQFYELIEAYAEQDSYSYLKIHGAVVSLLYEMCSSLLVDEEPKVVSAKKQYRIDEIVRYIEDNYNEDLTIDHIANYANMTPRYLNKLFKENFNQTPKDYLVAYRLRKSVEMLLHTDYPIVDIAIANGFPNMNSFYKSFENCYGKTPKQYRKLMDSIK